jgi:hypothetical protein
VIGVTARFNDPQGVDTGSASNVYLADLRHDTTQKATRSGNHDRRAAGGEYVITRPTLAPPDCSELNGFFGTAALYDD